MSFWRTHCSCTGEDDGKRFQKVDIVFNFVREIYLPTDQQTEQKEANKQEKTT